MRQQTIIILDMFSMIYLQFRNRFEKILYEVCECFAHVGLFPLKT